MAEGRRVELLCAEAAAVFETAGLPFTHPFRDVKDLVAPERIELSRPKALVSKTSVYAFHHGAVDCSVRIELTIGGVAIRCLTVLATSRENC